MWGGGLRRGCGIAAAYRTCVQAVAQSEKYCCTREQGVLGIRPYFFNKSRK